MVIRHCPLARSTFTDRPWSPEKLAVLVPPAFEDEEDEADTEEWERRDPLELLETDAVVLPSSGADRSLTVPSAWWVISRQAGAEPVEAAIAKMMMGCVMSAPKEKGRFPAPHLVSWASGLSLRSNRRTPRLPSLAW